MSTSNSSAILAPNATETSISGISSKEQEQRWTDEIERSYAVSKSHIDYETGELIDKKRVSGKHQIMIDRDAKRAENLIAWGNKLQELEDFAENDEGVLLKQKYREACRISERRALIKNNKLIVDFTKDLVPYSRPVGESNLQEIVNHRNIRMVSEITIGEQDVYISAMVRGGKEQVGGGIRGEIKEFSKQSRARCERHIRNVKNGSIKAILTLTYPDTFSNDGVEVKRHLATFTKRLKRMGVTDGIWFLEFQDRGAPHFHAFLGQWPSGGVKAVSNAWYEIVSSGDPKHLDWHLGKLSGRPCLEVMRKPHAASYYALKYGLKDKQKLVPESYSKVGKFWGCWGTLKPVYEIYYARGYDSCVKAVSMIAQWKSMKFGGSVGKGLATYSATLRGCTFEFLGSLMHETGWCPD